MKYTHSPKVIVIAGPPSAGKTTVADRLVNQLGYRKISLDTINGKIISEHGIGLQQFHKPLPVLREAFKKHFVSEIRELRFTNIVFEGCRVSHQYIWNEFRNTLRHAYGDYIFLQCYYLSPDRDTRYKQYVLRQVQMAKQAAKGNGDIRQYLAADGKNAFCEYEEPVLPMFERVSSPEDIVKMASKLEGVTHPSLPTAHKDTIQFIAESGAHNPFYQRVEIGGTVLLKGFTESEKSWENIRTLGLDFKGKTACDIGCMLGYYTFKLEEAGASPLGIDLDEGAIEAATHIATKRKSSARFLVHNSNNGFDEQFDVILALNVLHRVSDLNATCQSIFSASREVVLEVGESQLREIAQLGKPHGFKMRKAVKSHRISDVIGQRTIVHMSR